MTNPDLEALAAIEHEQWMFWSKAVASYMPEATKARWKGQWIPYDQLTWEQQEHDRVWASKAMEVMGAKRLEDQTVFLKTIGLLEAERNRLRGLCEMMAGVLIRIPGTCGMGDRNPIIGLVELANPAIAKWFEYKNGGVDGKQT